MSFLYEIVPKRQLILVRFAGAFSAMELIASTCEICSDKDYARGFDGFIDLTEIAVAITPAEIQELVNFTLAKKKKGYGKWAVLVKTPMTTALTMLYQQAVFQEHPFAIFSTREAVSEYLGRPMSALKMSRVPAGHEPSLAAKARQH